MRSRRPPRREAGFAMLLVFLLAACIAISLYNELPRVVFEAQRSREELLIARGEQYKRAIQLYFRSTRQYPPSLDALESTNNKRFLRKRYKDPMTGEDEWRIVHAGPGGVLTDSLVTKPPGPAKEAESATTASTAEAPPPVWLQQRPSDRGMQPGSAQGGSEQPVPESQEAAAPAVEQQQQQQLAAYPQPAEEQPSPTLEPGLMQPMAGPGQPPGTGFQPGFPTAPQAPGQQPPYPPVPIFGLQQPSGQPYVQPPVAFVPGQRPMPPAQPGPAGTQGTPVSNPAGKMIFDLLTTPNPRGLAAIQQAPGLGGQQIGGGIAGVASKLEAEGIKVYGDRTKYNEWEFVYDPRQDRSGAGLMRGPQGGSQGQGNSGIGTPIGPQMPAGPRPSLGDRLRK